MLPDRVSNPGPLTYESGALPIALRGPAVEESMTKGSRQYPNTLMVQPVETPVILIKQTVIRLIWICTVYSETSVQSFLKCDTNAPDKNE